MPEANISEVLADRPSISIARCPSKGWIRLPFVGDPSGKDAKIDLTVRADQAAE